MSEYLWRLRARVGTALILVPSAAALVFDAEGRLLLVRHRADGAWGTPGGAVEPDERPQDTVVREVLEETGLRIEPIRLRGVVGGPQFRVRYPNGDETGYVSSIFECQVVGGTLRPDGEEILEARFFRDSELSTLRLSRFAKGILAASGVPWGQATAEQPN